MEFEHMMYEVDRDAHIATITLNNPDKLNAINRQMHFDILALCEEIQNDDDVWVIIWTGAGRGFCSGADVGGGPRQEIDDDTPLNDRLDEDTWVSRQGLSLIHI